MKNTLRNGLVDLLDSLQIQLGSFFLVARRESGFVLLDGGLQSGLDHLVLESLLLRNENALFGRLDVRQLFHLPK